MMAMRALKRRLSNVVFACMLADQERREASPGGQSGTPADSSVAGPDPRTPALRTSHEAYAKVSLKKYKPMAARNEDRNVSSGLL